MIGIRFAFVYSVRGLGLPIAKASRFIGISRQTGYRWLKRFDTSPELLMTDCSRRPHSNPFSTPAAVVRQVLNFRDQFGYSARNIHNKLITSEIVCPSVTTIGEILKRHGRTPKRSNPYSVETLENLVDLLIRSQRKIILL